MDNDDNLYLDRGAAYAVAKEFGQRAEMPLTVTLTTLTRRLNEGGFLASTEEKRGTLHVRRQIDGMQRKVLHLRAEKLMAEEE